MHRYVKAPVPRSALIGEPVEARTRMDQRRPALRLPPFAHLQTVSAMKPEIPLQYFIVRVDGYSAMSGFALSMKDGWYVSEKGRFSGSLKARRFPSKADAEKHIASRVDQKKYDFVIEHVTEL